MGVSHGEVNIWATVRQDHIGEGTWKMHRMRFHSDNHWRGTLPVGQSVEIAGAECPGSEAAFVVAETGLRGELLAAAQRRRRRLAATQSGGFGPFRRRRRRRRRTLTPQSSRFGTRANDAVRHRRNRKARHHRIHRSLCLLTTVEMAIL